jgi:hypothetical protein
MRNRGLIVFALVVFLGVITFPIWYNLAGGPAARAPELTLPVGETECVAPTADMRATHMDILLEWRDEVVRNNVRDYTAANGRTYTMSLTGTCLKQCHTPKAEFCDRCHDYSGVSTPYCWDCHVDPADTSLVARRDAAALIGEWDGHE